MAETEFKEIEVPQQRVFNGTHFPLVLSPGAPGSSFTAAVRSHKPWLESRLLQAGAILFRGFPVNTASDFNDVVEAFSFEELPYVGGAAPAPTSSAGSSPPTSHPPRPENPLPPRNGSVNQVLEFLSKLFFFCEVNPASGGETPIVLSHVVYEKMKQLHPEFVLQLEEQGLHSNLGGKTMILLPPLVAAGSQRS